MILTGGYSRNRNEGTANLSQASYLQKPYQPTKLWKTGARHFARPGKTGGFVNQPEPRRDFAVDAADDTLGRASAAGT